MFLIGGGLLILLGLIAGVGGAIVLIVFNAVKAFKRTDITNGLVNYWPIGNGDMTDHVGSGTPSSASSTSWVANRFSDQNQALYVNGGVVTLPTGAYFYGAFTLMMWIRLTVLPTGIGGLFDCGNSPAPSDTISVSMTQIGVINVKLYSGTTNFATISGVQSVRINTWTHVAVTWDGTNGYLYLNGAVDSSTTGSGMPQNIARSACYLGNYYQSATASALYGYYDEIRIYNRYFIK
jgi:hypothetical protein